MTVRVIGRTELTMIGQVIQLTAFVISLSVCATVMMIGLLWRLGRVGSLVVPR